MGSDFTELSEINRNPGVDKYLFNDDGTYPNNRQLPLLLYHQVFENGGSLEPDIIERVFQKNEWENSWRNGLYKIHHYHSTAHEVLGIYRGWIDIQFGGPAGRILKATAGDVVIVPAGVAHKNINQSWDFRAVGAYPKGQNWDMNTGKQAERPIADERIKQVSFPHTDPVFGEEGRLIEIWKTGLNLKSNS